jgi:Tetracyclin repressor-like, C-terminal domain
VEELVEPDTDRLQRAITAEIQHDPALAEELVARLLRPRIKATADRLREAREAGQLAADVDRMGLVDLVAVDVPDRGGTLPSSVISHARSRVKSSSKSS